MTRVLVTGGGGFLGSHLVERLERAGHDVFVARRRDYDLTRFDDAERLFADAQPELVFHLAAEVGGIGANRANPGRYWYANLMMGAHVLELARSARGAEARDRRHRLRVSEVHAGAVLGGRPLERLPGGDQRAVRRREEVGARRRAGLPRAVRLERDLPLPANLYGPRDNFDLDLARDSGADPQDARGATGDVILWGDGSPTREFLFVDDCAEGCCSPRSATTARRR